VQAAYLKVIRLRTLNEKRSKMTAPRNVRRRSALQLSGQNKRRRRHASARKRNNAPEPWLLLLRQTRGTKTRRGANARNANVRSVKDGRRSARKRKPREKLGERNEGRPRQRHVRPSRLKDASPMRDVRAIVSHLWFHSHILLKVLPLIQARRASGVIVQGSSASRLPFLASRMVFSAYTK
jgi:hypothetical protein